MCRSIFEKKKKILFQYKKQIITITARKEVLIKHTVLHRQKKLI